MSERLAQFYESMGTRNFVAIAILALLIYLVPRFLGSTRGWGRIHGLGLLAVGPVLVALVASAIDRPKLRACWSSAKARTAEASDKNQAAPERRAESHDQAVKPAAAVRTIYVPIFKNRTFQRQLEMDLTRAVIRDVESMTPYKVVSKPEGADSELVGTIVALENELMDVNPENDRDPERYFSVEVLWRDRRTGKVLTRPSGAKAGEPFMPTGTAIQGGIASGQGDPAGVASHYRLPAATLPGSATTPPVMLATLGHDIPELGESTSTPRAQMVAEIAIKVVSMLEEPW